MEKEKKFEAFFKENYAPFYFFALQLINDEEMSKDIVNDSFELAWTKIDSIVSNILSELCKFHPQDGERHVRLLPLISS